jgi:hypothetical protein
MASSDQIDSNDFEEFVELKIVENKQKCMAFFKSKDLRKTTQMHGWQSLKKCTKCDNYEKKHGMKTVYRYCSSQNCNNDSITCPVKYKLVKFQQ